MTGIDDFHQGLAGAIDFLGRRYFRLVGRGASALWAALRAIREKGGQGGEVILPDIICPAVLEAVLAAGFAPRLVDIDPDTYTITPKTVAPILNSSTRAIIVAHLFGHAAPMAALEALARWHNIYLIEDAVQGIGGRAVDTGRSLGSHGDFAFVSFDTSKMIRGHGALLLYDDEAWTPYVDAAIGALPPRRDARRDNLLNRSLRDLYHGIGQAARSGHAPLSVTSKAFRELLPVYAPLLLRPFDRSPRNQAIILQDWQSLAQRVHKRNAKAALLREVLDDFPIEQPPYRSGDAIWRYSVRFLTPAAADHFVVTLRDQGGLASHLYYPLNNLYAPDSGLASTGLSRRVVNLWVDEVATEDYHLLVHRVAAKILSSESPY
jgi:dTDP-4-amino-4,6-dideoxygalactose transaminase